tara:strand:- start:1 stop:186 length:186 start_codon:yes stop_codon:yes gene_type:complete
MYLTTDAGFIFSASEADTEFFEATTDPVIAASIDDVTHPTTVLLSSESKELNEDKSATSTF